MIMFTRVSGLLIMITFNMKRFLFKGMREGIQFSGKLMLLQIGKTPMRLRTEDMTLYIFALTEGSMGGKALPR